MVRVAELWAWFGTGGIHDGERGAATVFSVWSDWIPAVARRSRLWRGVVAPREPVWVGWHVGRCEGCGVGRCPGAALVAAGEVAHDDEAILRSDSRKSRNAAGLPLPAIALGHVCGIRVLGGCRCDDRGGRRSGDPQATNSGHGACCSGPDDRTSGLFRLQPAARLRGAVRSSQRRVSRSPLSTGTQRECRRRRRDRHAQPRAQRGDNRSAGHRVG
jgi:hypothetical protein